MPKNINTPREELICGKLDYLTKAVIAGDKFTAIDLINSIRTDAEKMEQKLIMRKHEVFSAMATIHSGLAVATALVGGAPGHLAAAKVYSAAAAGAATIGTASMAGGIGLAALGAAVGIGSGLAASAIEGNNLGAEGGFLGTPTEDVFEDRSKKLGGSIKAQEVHLSINPVTYIQSEGDIFIGDGITVDTFRGLVDQAFVNRAQEALETGELELDSIITKG